MITYFSLHVILVVFLEIKRNSDTICINFSHINSCLLFNTLTKLLHKIKGGSSSCLKSNNCAGKTPVTVLIFNYRNTGGKDAWNPGTV